ncbi:Docking protein 1 [Mactra antiquata]
MADTSFLKSGDVLFQMKTLLRVSWVNKFCVLHGQSVNEHAYMELYDDKQSYNDYKQKQKKCDIKKLELQHLNSLKKSCERKKDGTEHMIEFRINKKWHFFLFKNESDFSDWYSKLESVYTGDSTSSRENSISIGDDNSDDEDEVVTVNSMYAQTDKVERFLVTVDESPLAKLCDIVGSMNLLLGTTDIAFEDTKSHNLKYSFQLCWMRRFGKIGNHQFSFQIGKKCPNGEGDILCQTDEAKKIHKLISKKSNSNGQTVIPHSSVKKVPEKIIQVAPSLRTSGRANEEPPLPKKSEDLGKNTSHGLINITPRHPGMNKKLPVLNPIVRDPSVNTANERLSVDDSGSDQKMDKGVQKKNGHLRPASYRSAQTNEVTKKLEEVLHSPPDNHQEPTKKDSVKTKEDKKREKEEKKERERREKEEKKEEERRMKEQEKERKLREKEAKKSGKKDKHRESEKLDSPNQRGSFKLGASRLYEDVDLVEPSSPTTPEPTQHYNRTDDPVQYAEPIKVKCESATNNEVLYDEAEPLNSKAPKKVVYAEPYTKKGGVPLPNTDVYTDVKLVKGDAWKSAGRETEEQEFEEDYVVIKRARDQMSKAPPPIPIKKYSDDEEVDDTYDMIGAKSKRSNNISETENLYGMASAKKVGKLPDVVEPEGDYRTDSDEGEEAVYDDPTYELDDYQTPGEISGGTTDNLSTYEEATPVSHKASTRKPATRIAPDADLYEEIS